MRVVALYARTSRPDQQPETQMLALRRYAEARGLEARECIDAAVSGAKTSRPAFDEMMRAARRRDIDGIVVQKLDRLGRNLRHLLNILGELEALGVQLVALDDGLDTTTPVGRLFFQIRASFAEYERALIVERTQAGLDRARREGRLVGRRAIDGEAVARVRRMRAAGRSLRQIAGVLNTSEASVRRALAR